MSKPITKKKTHPTGLIVKEGDPVLRAHAHEIPLKDIGSLAVKKMLREMAHAIASREDAVAVAAPQLGYPLKAFMVSHKVFEDAEIEPDPHQTPREHFIFINPEIIKTSKRRKKLEEGCLSVDGVYGIVKRPEKATVRAYDEHGKKFEWGGSGLLAQIFEHEVDHLNGTLFTDKAETTYPAPGVDDRKK